MGFWQFMCRVLGGPPRLPPPERPHVGSEPIAAPFESQTEDIASVAEPWWIPQGMLTLPAPLSASAESLMPELRARFEDLLGQPDLKLPHLPQVVQRALHMLQDEEVHYRKLTAVISEDQAVAAEILRIVGSVAYMRLFKVPSLEQALARLGRLPLQSTLLALSFKRLLGEARGVEAGLRQELWQAAVVSGVVVADAGKRRGMVEEEAFLVGLLHDIGKLVVLRLLHELDGVQAERLGRAEFDTVCALWHEELGQRLAREWRLLDPMARVVGDHHRTVPADDMVGTYQNLVQFADIVCALLEYTPYVRYDLFEMPCVQNLGIQDDLRTQAWLATLPGTIAEKTGLF